METGNNPPPFDPNPELPKDPAKALEMVRNYFFVLGKKVEETNRGLDSEDPNNFEAVLKRTGQIRKDLLTIEQEFKEIIKNLDPKAPPSKSLNPKLRTILERLLEKNVETDEVHNQISQIKRKLEPATKISQHRKNLR